MVNGQFQLIRRLKHSNSCIPRRFQSISYRHIWLYERGDYESFSQDILETNWDALKHNDIDIYARNVTDQISTLAKKHIPNKSIKIRQSDPSWLTSEIKQMIRKRKRLYSFTLVQKLPS